ncbi:30S ribosomal protein S6e [Sulfolobus acidocaldarius]|uniref:Small ribosomal subunit protein eS6 n=5 Tax=Sulfolobus acidocaldarius TaxID=2285 RepID=RS6E_SULAC|nr:30S ribosomal protein S6e [Sulfolobus acidocaldarius]Q4JAI1.1 RecName: Full=Small ribosomal subunit protein eS6; AltName: Full=30S ribosomal protein S6e [Sulfolobus acidocaldarius DSM 639]AAY80198.1 30S ribosomal protein S6E [Sulfolobus acidocaldarius DSM 639]AGE70777.1 30S ribosomal protein S6 [Sulfolobus acidocaldarius N8]AGE73048.1 30S ribosomal protein S6 [Sulfolobus acidocaldarius Ron12/I]ALU28899.1 30S ribosomal protein S6 [Sulfolobus acidocaldarius]ALU31622.1 30S ribosomal protein S
MPDFKIVVSDPKTKEDKKEKLKVKVSDKVKSNQGEKEGKAIPLARINDKIKQALNLDDFLTLEITKQEGDKKVKIKGHFKIEVDNTVPDGEVWISKSMAEKFGAEEFEALAYRTRAFQLSLDQSKLPNLVGTKIGDVIDINVSGVNLKLKITGGSDNSGFSMRFDVGGGAKRKILVSGPPGYYPKEDGLRRKRTVRGNMITPEIVQINTIMIR